MGTPEQASHARRHEALVLDLDGTLVADDGGVRPAVREALRAALSRGVKVMIATGRSELGTREVALELGLELPCVVYNGGGLWCPATDALLEERLLSNRSLQRTLAFARAERLQAIVMVAGRKCATPPSNDVERRGLEGLEGLEVVEWDELPTEYVMRVTLQSARHGRSEDFCARFEAEVSEPLYLTHFPLAWLANHRGSPLQVVDVQPPSRGKGEALRYLEECHGIAPERVVVVGDATNDLPMFERAGLAVAMANSMAETLAAAHRVIGDCNGDTLAELVEELFGA
jgi:HAD superfamily hydrolase (TIGR01484 family)